MSTITMTPGTLSIRLTPLEKVLGLLRDQDVPRAAVTGAEVVPDGMAAVRGLRAPGLALPGRRKLGTWRGRGVKRLVDVRRGQPALLVRVTGHAYDELLIATPRAAELAEQLQRTR